ncbi:hypothetical protein B0T10DRAFT_501122 [Thelonectria olida]|uniref:Uncharacterized protein n=1 Tax=Thelonectria olida TaxID=1576542 RepID=A0A9P8VQW1_9HYPO|nr:hypothetical protein B0T10DRAFT_501122 [Thelonectria olida]
MPSSQILNDIFDWLTVSEHQMSFRTNENVLDRSNTSVINTTWWLRARHRRGGRRASSRPALKPRVWLRWTGPTSSAQVET